MRVSEIISTCNHWVIWWCRKRDVHCTFVTCVRTPRTRLDDEGNSVKFQLRRGDCIPSSCVTDYMRRVQIAFLGSNSCSAWFSMCLLGKLLNYIIER